MAEWSFAGADRGLLPSGAVPGRGHEPACCQAQGGGSPFAAIQPRAADRAGAGKAGGAVRTVLSPGGGLPVYESVSF